MPNLHNASLWPIMSYRALTLGHEPHAASRDIASTSRISLVRAIDRLLRDLEGVLEQMVAQPERPISTIRLSRNPTCRNRKDLLRLFFVAGRPTSILRSRTMGEWLNQLYVIDDLKELDQKSHEILKAEVRRHLASHPEIIKVLKKELDPIYTKLASKPPRPK